MITTIQDDIVAMITHAKLKRTKPEDERKLEGDAKLKKPPFIKHYKTKVDSTGIEYKVGDTKEWNSRIWYYCDAPIHKGEARWHTYSSENCRTHKRWMKENGEGEETQSESPPLTNLVDDSESTTIGGKEEHVSVAASCQNNCVRGM